MPKVTLAPGLTIHFTDGNPTSRQAVLLLHGLGVNGSSWRLQIPDLEKAGYRTIAPDARGFGCSTYPGGKTSVASMAADMAKLLAALNAGPVDLVGISMGGAIALQFTLDYPHMVKKLVLVNTFAHLRPESLGQYFYYATRLILVHTVGLPAQAKYVAKRLFPRPEDEQKRQLLISQVMLSDLQGYRAAMRALAHFNVSGRLNEIHVPSLVITGEADNTVPVSIQRKLAGGIKTAQQAFIPDAGHGVIVDQPQLFNQVLLDFLKS